MADRRSAVVIGGGIAGLAAAYELHRGGVDVTVLEAHHRPGGLILTEHVDGCVLDAGPDAILVHKPGARALCEDLGLADRLVATRPPRTAFVLRGGRLHALPRRSILGFPTTPAAAWSMTLFSRRGRLRLAAEPFVPRGEDAPDESIGRFVRRRFGSEAVRYLAEPLMAGIHAGDVDRLSIRALFPDLWQAEREHGSVVRAFRRRRPDPDSEGAFRSLPGGLGELVEALVAALPPDTVRYGAEVIQILPAKAGSHSSARGFRRQAEDQRPGSDGWIVRLRSGLELRADALVLAVPAWAAGDLLAPHDPRLGSLCREIPYVSTATVVLGYPARAVRHPLEGTGFVVPRVERATRLTAATWITSKWPGRAPAGHVLLRGFLGGACDPDAVDLDDGELARLAHATLAPLLGIAEPPSLTRVYRWRRNGAQHVVGHLARVVEIDERCAALSDVYLAGSGFRASGIPDCVADARRVARHVRATIDR